MSDENNYNENNEDTQYTKAPDSGPVYQGEVQNYGDSGKGQNNGFGIASMILGILSIVACCIWYISGPLGIISIVLGILQIKNNEKKGMAIAGIVCSVIGIVGAVILVVFGAYLMSSGIYQQMMNEAGIYY